MSKTIEDILKEMPLDQEVKDRLTETWNTALSDAKVAQESKIRGELSEQYETDLERIHNAFGIFLEERIKPHVEELQEGVESVERIKTKYAGKIANIKEAAKRYIHSRVKAVDKLIEQRITNELTELHDDVVANRKATLQAITEAKARSERESNMFKMKAAKVVENIINVKVEKQLEPLREDIEASRRDNFGRELFEAFSTLFRRQFFNTNKEFKKIVESNKSLQKEVKSVKDKANKMIKESRDEAIIAKRAYLKLNESAKRSAAMNRLLKPLQGTARIQMKALLEATKTEKLDETFRKALPEISRTTKAKNPGRKSVNENQKKTIKSMEFHSGGTVDLNETLYDPFDDEVSEIKRLAGNR